MRVTSTAWPEYSSSNTNPNASGSALDITPANYVMFDQQGAGNKLDQQGSSEHAAEQHLRVGAVKMGAHLQIQLG